MDENVQRLDAVSQLAYVYLLVDMARTRFKIGYSVDPWKRLKSFTTIIDKGRSLQISCAPSDVRRLEKILHAWFDDFSVDPSLIQDDQGHTEWFDLCCWDKVVEYVRLNHEWLRCGTPEKLDVSRANYDLRRLASRTKSRKMRSAVRRKQVTVEVGPFSSIADLMTKLELATECPIIGKSVTLTMGPTGRSLSQDHGFGRMLWELAKLEERGIVKLNEFDLQALSLTFTRLNSETFDTQSLYAIKFIPEKEASGRHRQARR